MRQKEKSSIELISDQLTFKNKPSMVRCSSNTLIIEEERLFNNTFVKEYEGRKHRCSKLVFTKEHLEVDTDKLINHYTLLINSFLKRIINPSSPFYGHKSGKHAISELTKKFRNELKSTISTDRTGYRVLKSQEAYAVTCYIVTKGLDPSSYTGTHSLELKWYAECSREDKLYLRPIVQAFYSNYSK